MTKLHKAYSYSFSMEIYCLGLINIFFSCSWLCASHAYGNLLPRSPLEESMLASKSLPAYVGDFPLVDRFKKHVLAQVLMLRETIFPCSSTSHWSEEQSIFCIKLNWTTIFCLPNFTQSQRSCILQTHWTQTTKLFTGILTLQLVNLNVKCVVADNVYRADVFS